MDRYTVKHGFFEANLLWTLAGVLGVFMALDLFLFFLFWEVMLIPMYFMIAIWGHENRGYAAMKFFIFYPGQRPANAGGYSGTGHGQSQRDRSSGALATSIC